MADGPIVCTNCGTPMRSRSCKVRCPRCGYFEDCSDTGLPGYCAAEDSPPGVRAGAPAATEPGTAARRAPPGPTTP